MPDPGQRGGTTDLGQVVAPNTPGTWAYQECFHADGTLVGHAGVIFLPQGGPVDPIQLMEAARNHLSLPPPPILLSPAVNLWQFVQMPTWAWVPTERWVPLSASTSAGPITVTVSARPVRLVVSYQVSGNGSTATATCAGPGTPYSDQLATAENPQNPLLAASPDCGWTWHDSSADTSDQKYAVTAHIVYHALWAVRGGRGGGDLGELSSQDANFRLTVGEIQALNIAPR